MIGLINAVGLGTSIRQAGADTRGDAARYGIQVPIPLAQREAKAESPSAVFSQREEQPTHEERAAEDEQQAPLPSGYPLGGPDVRPAVDSASVGCRGGPCAQAGATSAADGGRARDTPGALGSQLDLTA